MDSVLTRARRVPSFSPSAQGGGQEAEVKVKVKAHWEAPEPLLANWGVADGVAYRPDLVLSPSRTSLTV